MNRIPNQTGSTPRVLIMGKNTGIVINSIPIGSKRAPKMIQMIIINQSVVIVDIFHPVTRLVTKADAPPSVYIDVKQEAPKTIQITMTVILKVRHNDILITRQVNFFCIAQLIRAPKAPIAADSVGVQIPVEIV